MTRIFLLFLLLLPGLAAAADKATEAALEADRVNQEYCADLYSRQVGTAAQAIQTVGRAWEEVSAVYEETKAPFLLYWRGALAQCLGRNEQAERDLQAFVETQIQQTMFASLVRSAQTRLRRIDGTGVGLGVSAMFAREAPILLASVRYLGGSGMHVAACTDDGGPGGQVENTACAGGLNPRPVLTPAKAPLGFELEVEGYFLRFLGLGARVVIENPLPAGVPTSRSPGAHFQLQVGPRLRIVPPSASRTRAGWLRAQVNFAADWGSIDPLAGSMKYRDDLGGFLDAGTYALRHAGVGIVVGGAVEVAPAALLTFEGRFALFVPYTPSRAVQPSAVELRIAGEDTESTDDDVFRSESVERDPAALSASRMEAGFRFGALFPALPKVAIGPFFDVGLQRKGITFGDDPDQVWCAAEDTNDCVGDGDSRKVFSTRHDDLYVRLGIDVRFGAGRHE